MLTIKRIADARLAARVCDSLGAAGQGAFAYGAFQNGDVLATAAFSTAGGCVTLCGADTGRRMDAGLVDGMARAAFAAALRTGAKTARLGADLAPKLRLALTKLGYEADAPFSLDAFFARKNCMSGGRGPEG
ncbi:hypothetical protein [Anaerotruncus colihominis]|uniref:N-acetyltransferase domain-containing protein n=1 Tax=Anaerotruncus colihominis TaxID=169435 RepID=A0A845SQM8_9FIRM|nr:hypothetical protein [Anaerotruncus colihominis]MCR2025438.1 hypothetical protein [Anaerotruncus colihominis]NDO37935.1 hypothetical protein [Anaerotruncus colihominis]